MDAQQLFKAGKLAEAIAALTAQLRDNPADQRGRTFLFELLCFAGEYDRAEEQLTILEQGGSKASMLGALLYKAAINAEKTRQEMFEKKSFPPLLLDGAGMTIGGKLNGKEFTMLTDADSRIGEKLEVFAGGDYLWISFHDIASVRVNPPKRLRDLLWIPAKVTTGPTFHSRELGEIMIPAMAPLSWQHPDEEVQLGRVSEWCEDETGAVAPYGLKCILVDGEEVPVVEIRELEIYPQKAVFQ
ncbi:MAG: tetratricopeptide repeat protein [Acidobacteriaceae bacterium]|nr:tetratricopeptide repeat protein [Acidobacteriaceae bacterium]MBV9225489.1 tetratricopeptide repeat protein [Acidobacteriaceae bacterium]MBV9307981.1 tetratricopeptide repeat protein [Acidobacteriaceae bacterium]